MAFISALDAPDLFAARLLSWYDENKRDLSWRQTRDPYLIWLSEVMLQQTRVDQATPYFEQFRAAFPTAEDLANADLDAVLKLWEGLGYYSRARNLHEAAKQVVQDHGGEFPTTMEGARSLRGVGPYTAAAVLSIAFGVPAAVVDGNVTRVITRLLAIPDDVTGSKTRNRIQEVADTLLDTTRSGDYNQAVMELGATICKPRQPSCESCPASAQCVARSLGTQESFPVKRRKKPIPHHDVVVGVITDPQGNYLVAKRPVEAMLGGLWEFPGGKREQGESLPAALRRELQEELGIETEVGGRVCEVKHAYSHFKITLSAFDCRITEGTPTSANGMPLRWTSPGDLEELAFPKANRHLIDKLRERSADADEIDATESS